MILRRLGEFIFRGRMPAIIVTTLLATFAIIFPLMSYLFGGVVPALVTLRKGPVAGLQVVGGSLLLLSAALLLARLNPQVLMVLVLGIWLPSWFCAAVLRWTAAQGRMLLAAGLCGFIYIALSHLLLGDVVQWWKAAMELWVEKALTPEGAALYGGPLAQAAPFMNSMVSAGLMFSLALTVLCARWWQSHLFHAGGFGQEFRALCLPRALIIPLLAGVVLAAAGHAAPGPAALDVLIVIVFLYVFQGLAAMHRLVAHGRLAGTWLVVMYVLLVLLPQAVLFIACVGMVDSWWPRAGTPTPNDKSP